jgi:hypothetical protein
LERKNSKYSKANADVRTVEQGSVRPSYTLASVKPSLTPHLKSYMEVLAMVERGEKPSGIHKVNDNVDPWWQRRNELDLKSDKSQLPESNVRIT